MLLAEARFRYASVGKKRGETLFIRLYFGQANETKHEKGEIGNRGKKSLIMINNDTKLESGQMRGG